MMYEKMAVYQYVYGLKPIGPHRGLADRILTPRREQCPSCHGRGIVTLRNGDSWALCGPCEGTGGHWACGLEEVEALRRRVLHKFPDSAVADTPHNFVSRGIVFDVGANTVIDLERGPADVDTASGGAE
jgi:hypothetical protein